MKDAVLEKKLGDVVAVQSGFAFKSNEYSDSGHFLVRIANVQDGYLSLKKPKYVTLDAKTKRFELRSGDILTSLTGNVGRVAKVEPEHLPAALNQRVARLIPKPDAGIDAQYLLRFLHSSAFSGFLEDRAHGAAQANVSPSVISEVPIPLPSLEEQQRIVAVLDEAFEGLTRARIHAEANLKNAREFFLGVLRDVFSNDSEKWETDRVSDVVAQGAPRSKAKKSKDSTQTGGRGATLRPIAGEFSLTVLLSDNTPRKGWMWSQLTDLARLESGHTPSRKHPEYWGGDVPWIGIKDARDHHGREVHSTLENTNPLGIANSSARVLPENTVCLSRTASVGYVTIMGREMATSQDFVNWVCSDALLPDFLKFLLLAQGDEIRRFSSGSVHQTIYFPEVKAFHICHPPVSVQQEICKALEAIRDESHKLIEIYEAKLQNLEELRQSLLQKAFAGQLT